MQRYSFFPSKRKTLPKIFGIVEDKQYFCNQNQGLMKHAYLIMAHGNWEILRVLIFLLDDERNDIFLHIDKKADMPEGKTMETSHAQLFVLKNRIDVRWGNLSQIKAEYALFEEAVKNGPYAYYHLISGQDLPIKTQDEIHRFFDENQGKEFVGINHGEEFEWDCRRKMMRYWLLTRFTRSQYGWLNEVTKRLNKYLSILLSLVIHRSKLHFAKGANWVSISQKCVEYVISQKNFVMKRFNFTFCPDEFFIQTLVWNHPELRQALYHPEDEYEGCMRLIDWKRGNPYVWTLADKEELMTSHRLFARKFTMQHSDIIYWLKDELGSRDL